MNKEGRRKLSMTCIYTNTAKGNGTFNLSQFQNLFGASEVGFITR
jgi:hypothetical protein